MSFHAHDICIIFNLIKIEFDVNNDELLENHMGTQ
jgi:hypothetical protein